jgi:hypothetical protein
MSSFANKSDIEVLFAHVAYQFPDLFNARNSGMRFAVAKSAAEIEAKIGTADVVVVSGLWKNDLVAKAPAPTSTRARS